MLHQDIIQIQYKEDLAFLHTSNLAESCVSLRQLTDRLGHADDQITKNSTPTCPKKNKKGLFKSSLNS